MKRNSFFGGCLTTLRIDMKRLQFVVCCLIICALFTGCCPCRHLTTSTGTRDSLHVQIRHHTIWVPDTIQIHLPAERTEQTVRTDSSHLETTTAVSDARINPDGSLYHSLENKKDDLKIPTKRPIEYRDSIVYRDREVEVEKIVEVERKLTWWQKTQIRGFWFFLAILIIVCRKEISGITKWFIQKI